MSESHSSASHEMDYAGPGIGGQPKLLRTGGMLGIASACLGLLVNLAHGLHGLSASFAFSWIVVLLGAVGFVLSVIGGVTESPKIAEDTAVMAALFACCMGIIGGLLEMAVWRRLTMFTHG